LLYSGRRPALKVFGIDIDNAARVLGQHIAAVLTADLDHHTPRVEPLMPARVADPWRVRQLCGVRGEAGEYLVALVIHGCSSSFRSGFSRETLCQGAAAEFRLREPLARSGLLDSRAQIFWGAEGDGLSEPASMSKRDLHSLLLLSLSVMGK
jgi:hypothetical protein